MIFLKVSSLVITAVLIFALGMSFGINTEHNRMLWSAIEHSAEIQPVPPQEREELYRSLKHDFAFRNRGDLR